jgi:CheY-like chemotaxis protein
MSQSPAPTILVVDDDADDRLLIEDAFRDCAVASPRQYLDDGEQLMDYLNRRGRYADARAFPMPGLILLDLNMPRKDGREALREIKSNPGLRHIPVIVLTTSKADEDIGRTYREGGNSFITKPAMYTSLLSLVRTFRDYWLQVVDLPK